MDWLKKILEGAKIVDGKLDVESVLDSVNTEFPKYAVPKDKYNTLSTAKTDLEAQLKDANKQIEDFKGMDIDKIKQAADDWKTKFEQAEAEGKKKLEGLQFDHALDSALSGVKAKNAKAVKALLDMEGLKLNNGEIVGLTEQLEKLKTDNDYLFESEETKPTIVKPTPGTTLTGDDALRAAMGLPPTQATK